MTFGTTARPSCGAQVATGNRFCTSRGKPIELPRFCSQCGAQLEATAKFCGTCGGTAAAPEATATGTSPAPGPQATAAPRPQPSPGVAAAPPVATAASSGEPVLGVIAGAQRRKGLLGYQSFNVVVTRDRLVFVLMTR
jgi:hypothetical protein